MLYILYGDDDFSCNRALQKIKAELGCGELIESNTTVLDGKTATLEQITEVCSAMPFFAPQRLVIIEGLMQRPAPRRSQGTGGAADKSAKDFASAVEEYFRHMPGSTVLVIVDGEIRGANALLKRLSPLARVQRFQLPRGERLQEWVRNRVAERGGSISPAAARLAANYASDNLWSLSNEIDKLLLYSGTSIEETDVMETMSQSQEANQFAMMDAIISGNIEKAQRILHQLLDEGSRAPQIVTFILRELSLILRSREAIEDRLPRGEVSARVGLAPGFRADKIFGQARECGMEEISVIYSLLLDTDMAVKTGAMGEELALDMFLANACGR